MPYMKDACTNLHGFYISRNHYNLIKSQVDGGPWYRIWPATETDVDIYLDV